MGKLVYRNRRIEHGRPHRQPLSPTQPALATVAIARQHLPVRAPTNGKRYRASRSSRPDRRADHSQWQRSPVRACDGRGDRLPVLARPRRPLLELADEFRHRPRRRRNGCAVRFGDGAGQPQHQRTTASTSRSCQLPRQTGSSSPACTDPVVSGVTYTVQFSRARTNNRTLARSYDTPFSIPAGTTFGRILVNGTGRSFDLPARHSRRAADQACSSSLQSAA